MQQRVCRPNDVLVEVFLCLSIFLSITSFFGKKIVYMEWLRADQMEQKYNV